MADTLTALVAAGVVYDKSDFADPQLDGPTALTVTADGRVFGHLATWGTPHIGMGRQVTPPKSPSGYQYFHQGVVSTRDGDLPVGKLTLGTGHAPVARGVDAMAAAAHYDNTGSVVAAVRAGEDEHGIWLAGRLVPGISDERVDELRRSGVSGDWRGVNGRHELVAALAVNVPGFPIPRTEELVASGTMALVAAGIVVPPGADLPQNVDEFNAVLASAVAERVDAVVAEKMAERDQAAAARARRGHAAAQVQAVVASARRERLAAIVAAAVDGDLEPARADGMIALLPSEEDAQRLAVENGEPVEELHLTVGYFPDASAMPDDEALVAALSEALPVVDGAIEGVINGRAVFNPQGEPASVYLVQADGLTAANQSVMQGQGPGDYDAYLPHITAAYAPEDSALSEVGPVRFDRVRISRAGEHTDIPLGPGMTAAGRRIRSTEGARRYGLSIGDLIPDAATIGQAVGNDVGRAAEGVAKALGAKPAPAPKKAPAPQATAPAAKPQVKEGETPRVDESKTSKAPTSPPAAKPSDSGPKPDTPQVEGNVPEKPESSEEPKKDASDEPDTSTPSDRIKDAKPGDPVTDTEVPSRIDAGAGTDHPMNEDESPMTGAHGGELVAFSDGIAYYDDGTQTDGTTWTVSEPEDDKPVTASLWERTVGKIAS